MHGLVPSQSALAVHLLDIVLGAVLAGNIRQQVVDLKVQQKQTHKHVVAET